MADGGAGSPSARFLVEEPPPFTSFADRVGAAGRSDAEQHGVAFDAYAYRPQGVAVAAHGCGDLSWYSPSFEFGFEVGDAVQQLAYESSGPVEFFDYLAVAPPQHGGLVA